MAPGLIAANANKTPLRLQPEHSSFNWYFSREEIENKSPSRLDGFDLKLEMFFRRSYCSFLQVLGTRLDVPPDTIATAIIFCQRFYLRLSLLENNIYAVATSCMFLAGKVEETPRSLEDLVLKSYEIRPDTVGPITAEEQKQLVLVGERLLRVALRFDLSKSHLYEPLVAAINRLSDSRFQLGVVAEEFVNDALCTSLCLQLKPEQIIAGAIFLAAKCLKVELATDGEKLWWEELGATPQHLEEFSIQLLELYAPAGWL